MKVTQMISSETTFNTHDQTNATEKVNSLLNINNCDAQNLYNSEYQTDDSFEMEVLYKNHPENEWIKIEHTIVMYLKQLGLKMKTDPIEKQEQFYRKPKRRVNKSSTTCFDRVPQIEVLDEESSQVIRQQMSLEMNSIRQRRTPSSTPQSSPLIMKQTQLTLAPKEKRMSIFQKMQHQKSLSSDDEEMQQNILRNEKRNSSSDSDNEENYFQNL